ncbi:hypothetical protein AOLI_G00185960 [Acnodon oligacanthus]
MAQHLHGRELIREAETHQPHQPGICDVAHQAGHLHIVSAAVRARRANEKETVIVRPTPRQPNVQTLDRVMKKIPAPALQQAEMRRRTDLLRARTSGPRDLLTAKRKAAKEKMTPEQELQKCIQDFRRIKIPERFPDRKNMWQSELLRKYHL